MLVTPQEVAIESIRVLIGKLGVTNLMYKDFDKDFAGKIGQVVNARVPASLHANSFNTEVEVQDIDESTVPVTLDRLDDVTVPLNSIDKTLKLKDFSKQVIEPAVKALAEKIESNALAQLIESAHKTVAVTPNAADLDDIAKMGEILDDIKAPQEDRSLVLAPKHKYNYAKTANLSNVSYAGDNKTLRNAILGEIYGFNTYMSAYAPKSTAAVVGDATAFKAEGTKGAKVIKLTNVQPATAWFRKGDKIIVEGHIYTVTQEVQAASNTVNTLKIDDGFHRTIANPQAVSGIPVTKPISVGFHKDAVAFVNRPLEMPDGAAKCYVASAHGISVRVVFDYDIKKKQDLISFDILYGLSTLNGDLAVRLA